MYAFRPHLRFLVFPGCLGLAALAARGAPLSPSWIVGAIALPVALLEIGAGILEGATTSRWRRVGVRLQVAGALVYVAVYVLLAAVGIRGGWDRILPLFLAVGALGLWAAAIVLRDARRLVRGQDLDLPDPAAAGERLAGLGVPAVPGRGRLRDHLTVIGWGPIAAGGICLAFVVAILAIFLVRRTWEPEITVALGFFGSGVIIAITSALERRLTFVPGSRARRWTELLQAVGVTGFGASLVGAAIIWTDEPAFMRLLAGAFGALCALGGPVIAVRQLRRGQPGSSRVVPTREGLLELSRSAAVLYPWEAVASIAVGEWAQHPALLVDLDLDAPEAVRVLWARRDDPVRLARRRLKNLARLRAFAGCALPVMAPLLDEPVADVFERLRLHLTGERPRDALPSAWDVLAAWTPTGRRSAPA